MRFSTATTPAGRQAAAASRRQRVQSAEQAGAVTSIVMSSALLKIRGFLETLRPLPPNVSLRGWLTVQCLCHGGRRGGEERNEKLGEGKGVRIVFAVNV